MQEIRQCVDHRDRASGGQPLDIAVIECAYDQSMDETRENPGRVFDRLPAAELNIVPIQEKRIAAQLVYTHLKGHAGAGGGLRKNHRPSLASQYGRGVPSPFCLQVSGQRHDFCHFVQLEVRLLEKVLHDRMKRRGLWVIATGGECNFTPTCAEVFLR